MTAAIEANDGRPVDVVLEMTGGHVFDGSLSALAPFGRLVAYGNSTREKVRVSNAALLKTSRAVVGFWLMHCLGRRDMTAEPLADLFARDEQMLPDNLRTLRFAHGMRFVQYWIHAAHDETGTPPQVCRHQVVMSRRSAPCGTPSTWAAAST